MRDDLVGFFWNDLPPPKPPKAEKVKRTPPERTWESPDYLPHYEQACAFPVPRFDANTLHAAQLAGETLVIDTEVAPNYFLFAYMSFQTGRVGYVEVHEGADPDAWRLAVGQMRYVLENFRTVGFNSAVYDIPILTLAIAGYSCAAIKNASDRIIGGNEPGWALLREARIKKLDVNHIDLIETAPLSASLKIYAGRLHAPRIQDLPFDPQKPLTQAQIVVTRWYCVNDLISTAHVYNALTEQIQLREKMTVQYGIDLRSKSDAQVAEAVVMYRLAEITRQRPAPGDIAPGTMYRYQPPSYLKFNSELMQWAFAQICDAQFVIVPNGTIPMPESVENMRLTIGHSTYRMGVGGLHSTEERAAYVAPNGWSIRDVDVTSYYPMIILNTGLYPDHIGPTFSTVYRDIVQQRLAAKARGDKAQAESLKIAVNGIFGKLSSPHSGVYSPRTGMQVTVTGQLTLLMFIERLELAGFRVVSGNTDGVVILVPDARASEFEALVKEWESVTGFETEETIYQALYSRDVNNYIAIKRDGKTKNRGAYRNPWANVADGREAVMRFQKNPVNTICIEAVEQFLINGTPLLNTIMASRDPRKFVTVRKVKGGAVKDGVYLGRAVRWYYAREVAGEIVYALTGNKVARSDGAKPLMDLPVSLPDDVDFDWYEREARSMLVDLGAIEPDKEDVCES